MAVFVPAATNLTTNPKPASLLGITVDGGASAPLIVYDQSYSGDTSVRVTFNGIGQLISWSNQEDGAFVGTATGEDQMLRAKVRLLTLTGIEASVKLWILYTDDTLQLGDEAPVSLTPGTDWNILEPPEIEADPDLTISSAGVMITSTSASTQTAYLGGFDLRSNQIVDGFVVGDGQRSSWSGDPNESTSIREEYRLLPSLARGAQFRYSTKYYVVNRKNVIIDDITDFVLPTPSISIDTLGEATKGTISISLSRPDIVLPFRDMWISPRLTIEHPDGTIEGGTGVEGMLGIYSVEPASERYDAMGNAFNYTGYDLLWVLEQETLQPFPNSWTYASPEGHTYLVQPGGPLDFRGLLKQVFEDGGFTEADGMLVLPNPANPPTVQFPWGAEVGVSRLDFITKTCDSMAWRRPWITLQGQATSGPLVDLATVEPDFVFESGDTSDVRWPFEVDPEPENMANRINVFAKFFGYQQVINVIVENADDTHPFSTTSLGYLRPDGSIQKRYIDAPRLDKITLQSHAEAIAIGNAELAKLGMLPYTVRMRTRAMIRQLNEVYQLNLTDAQGDPIPNGQGKYWCIGWQMSLGAPWEMTHNLRRVIPIFETEYGPADPVHHFWTTTVTPERLKQLQKQLQDINQKIGKIKQRGITKKEENELKKLKKDKIRVQKEIRGNRKVLVPD